MLQSKHFGLIFFVRAAGGDALAMRCDALAMSWTNTNSSRLAFFLLDVVAGWLLSFVILGHH